jgi:hypothetical protein
VKVVQIQQGDRQSPPRPLCDLDFPGDPRVEVATILSFRRYVFVGISAAARRAIVKVELTD